jgi:DNA-binding PadR family transcriptional regulator
MTDHDHFILGFLCGGPLTGYGIKKIMDMSTRQFAPASFGKIYPSLAKLAFSGFVKLKAGVSGGRAKKSYEITKDGKSAFRAWLLSPLEAGAGMGPFLSRLFFLDIAARAESEAFLAAYLASVSERISWLSSLPATVSAAWEKKPGRFQEATIRFGLDYYLFLSKWLSGLSRGVS